MRRERVVKIFVGSPDEVERRANDLLAEKAVVLADRVRVAHWGADPVSLVVLIERDPDNPEVEAHYREIAERIIS